MSTTHRWVLLNGFLHFPLGNQYLHTAENNLLLFNADDGTESEILSNATLVSFYEYHILLPSKQLQFEHFSFIYSYMFLSISAFFFRQQTHYNSSEIILSPDRKFALLRYSYEKVPVTAYFLFCFISFILVEKFQVLYNIDSLGPFDILGLGKCF